MQLTLCCVKKTKEGVQITPAIEAELIDQTLGPACIPKLGWLGQQKKTKFLLQWGY